MFLTDNDRATIVKTLATLATPVALIFFEQSIGCDACAPTRRLLEQIEELTDWITVETLNVIIDKDKAKQHGIDRVPAIVLSAPGRDRVRFYGAPFGNELMSLVEAIRMTGTGETGLSEHSRAQLKTLAKPVDVKVFFTPTCVYCPQMITLANAMAVNSPMVSATAIDATEFPDLVRHYNVNGVPKTIINDAVEIMGAAPEEELVTAIC